MAMVAAWIGPGTLLGGPQGRRLCWELLQPLLPGRFRLAVAVGRVINDPAAAREIALILDSGGLEELTSTSGAPRVCRSSQGVGNFGDRPWGNSIILVTRRRSVYLW